MMARFLTVSDLLVIPTDEKTRTEFAPEPTLMV